MSTEIIPVYDTDINIGCRTNPKLLARLLSEHLSEFMNWVSFPEEDDPAGERWTPEWFQISQATAELDRVLNDSEAMRLITLPGYTDEELAQELRDFRTELGEASANTQRFFLSMY